MRSCVRVKFLSWQLARLLIPLRAPAPCERHPRTTHRRLACLCHIRPANIAGKALAGARHQLGRQLTMMSSRLREGQGEGERDRTRRWAPSCVPVSLGFRGRGQSTREREQCIWSGEQRTGRPPRDVGVEELLLAAVSDHHFDGHHHHGRRHRRRRRCRHQTSAVKLFSCSRCRLVVVGVVVTVDGH